MSEKKSIMDYETVALDDEKNALVIIDQTKLPYKTEILELTKQKEETEALLEEKMDRWVYLNDLAEKIDAQKNG